MINVIKKRLQNMITRCVIASVNSSTGFSTAQIVQGANETRTGVELLQSYGLATSPPIGSEGVGIAVGGNIDHTVVIMADKRTDRVKNLDEGEVCLYSKFGQKITLKSDGDIELTVASGKNILIGGGTVRTLLDNRFTDAVSAELVKVATATSTLSPYVFVPTTFASIPCTTTTTKAS